MLKLKGKHPLEGTCNITGFFCKFNHMHLLSNNQRNLVKATFSIDETDQSLITAHLISATKKKLLSGID